MFCKNCGNEIKEGVKFCSKCGTPIGVIQTSENQEVPQAAVSSSQTVGHTYTFKNNPNTRSIIRYIKGGQVIFKFDEDKFSWQRELQYDEEVISVPYYLINDFKFENKVSVGMVLTGIFALICGLICFVSDLGFEGFLLLLLGAFVLIRISVNTCFFISLKDGNKYKVKLRKIRKDKIDNQKQMTSLLETQIRNAKNTGEAVQKYRTGATVGDVINAIKRKKQ